MLSKKDISKILIPVTVTIVRKFLVIFIHSADSDFVRSKNTVSQDDRLVNT